MSRRRFFVPAVRRGAAELTGAEAEHLVRVLRAEAGQVYEISDNQDLYLAEITTARKSLVVFEIREQLPVTEPLVDITLVAALIKFDRFEWLVEKATELGVLRIQPFEAIRTDKGLGQAAAKRSQRWEKIAVEASQQSRRVRLPVIEPSVRFSKAIQVEALTRLLLDEDPAALPILSQLPGEPKQGDSVALLLGPEGGWTDTERNEAIAAGWRPASFGKTVLRAETAAAAGLAIIQAVWEERHNGQGGSQPAAS